jgi:hypothetical protein
MNYKDGGGKWSWPNLRYYSNIWSDGLRNACMFALTLPFVFVAWCLNAGICLPPTKIFRAIQALKMFHVNE